MSAILESALTPQQRAEAEAADRRMSAQVKAMAHYMPMAQQMLTDALRDACKEIERTARVSYALAYWSQAEWEDNWANEDPKGYAEWLRLVTLAGCRPEVAQMPGHCWECERNYAEAEIDGLRVVNRRFLRCADHSAWYFTRLVPAREE